MDDTKNVLEIEKKLKTMPKYSLRKQTVENPPVAESSTRGKVMVGNIKQKALLVTHLRGLDVHLQIRW